MAANNVSKARTAAAAAERELQRDELFVVVREKLARLDEYSDLTTNVLDVNSWAVTDALLDPDLAETATAWAMNFVTLNVHPASGEVVVSIHARPAKRHVRAVGPHLTGRRR